MYVTRISDLLRYTVYMASRIKEERIKRGWSQHELGARCGLPASTISSLERGYSYPWPGWRRRLAAALKVAETTLFDPESAEEPTST